MLKKRELPVYLFTGFLESGKTTFIREILQDGEFEDGLRTLLLVCEEGLEELDNALLKKNKITPIIIEEEDKLVNVFLKECEDKYHPQRVIIEFNGMWNSDNLIENILPENWLLVQVFTTIDATTYMNYLNNMKQLILGQVSKSDLVIFNRCAEDIDRAAYRRSIKAINRRTQIIYENMNGEVDDQVEEELPYDMTAPIIEIEDDDFGLFYLDIMEHTDKYLDKTISFKAIVYKGDELNQDEFVPGRFAMTCCADDIGFIGLISKYPNTCELKQREWIQLNAVVKKEYREDYEGDGPILYISSLEKTQGLGDDLVYFN